MATKDPIFQPHSVIVVFELLEKEVIRFQHLMVSKSLDVFSRKEANDPSRMMPIKLCNIC